MSEPSDIPKMADIVFYYDENKQPHAAIVTHVHDRRVRGSDRPICNLAIFTRDAKMKARCEVEPAYHDGEKWRLVEKWSWPDEVPAEEYEHLPEPKFRKRQFGVTEQPATT